MYLSNPARQDPNSVKWKTGICISGSSMYSDKGRSRREGFVFHGFVCAPTALLRATQNSSRNMRTIAIWPLSLEFQRAAAFFGQVYRERNVYHNTFKSGLSFFGLGDNSSSGNVAGWYYVCPLECGLIVGIISRHSGFS